LPSPHGRFSRAQGPPLTAGPFGSICRAVARIKSSRVMSALVSLGKPRSCEPECRHFHPAATCGKVQHTDLVRQLGRLCSGGVMAHNRSEIPHHHERQLLQRLRDAGWVKASKILATPSFIEKLVAKGWIETSIIDGHLCYRITDQGLAAKKMPI
jgi:hypothetical protein